MGIEVKLAGELSCPVVVCDVCGKQIMRARDGNVYHDMRGGRAIFLHKNPCTFVFEQGLEAGDCGTFELDVFLIYLEGGLKLDRPDALERAAELACL